MQTAAIDTEQTIDKIKFVHPPYVSTKLSFMDESISVKYLIKNPLQLADACMIIEKDKLLVL